MLSLSIYLYKYKIKFIIMKKISILLLIIAFNAPVFGQNTEIRKLDAFTSLQVSEGIDINLIKGKSPQAKITVKGIDMKEVLTDVSGGELKIHLDGHSHNNVDVSIDLTYVMLESITASSAADVKSLSIIEASTFKIKASSAADITLNIKVKDLDVKGSSAADILLSGSVDKQTVDISSAADYKAFELISKFADISASSASDAKINVTEQLVANANSGASIKYKGNPDKIREHSSSGGDVEQY